MNNIDDKTLRKAQIIMLDTLVEVDKICKKHNIQYWLDFGTLLGAIRHQGFIPWDDDLDIAMNIEDYHKFCSIAQDELPKSMFLQTNQTDTSFPYSFAKVRNDKGEIIEKHESGKNIKYNQNIFIDIFPMMNIKNNMFSRVSHFILALASKLFSYKYINIRLLETFFIEVDHLLHNSKINIDNKIVRSAKMQKLGFEVDYNSIYPLKKTLFENKEFYVPNDCDKYLKVLYGDDYMTLPPKSSRHTHASSIKIYD